MELGLAALLGLGIGLTLGTLGGGGSILAVPALVYGLGQPVARAVPTSLIVVGLSAAGGAFSHLRGGRVAWRTALGFGAAGIGGAFVGAYLNHLLAEPVVLVGFALLMIIVGVAMLRRPEREPSASDGPRGTYWARAVGAGAMTGVLTGLFGVGGGFLVVPALVLLLGLPMPLAVGTSLVVIVINAASGVFAHLGYGGFDPALSGVFAAGGVAGAVIGGHFGGRVPAARLSRWFAYLVLAVAGFVLVQALVLDASPPT